MKNILNPKTLVNMCISKDTWEKILEFHELMVTDEYVKLQDRFYKQCIRDFGTYWFYMDIINVLYTASKVRKPINYLEIGVRRGRSLCTVIRGCPEVDIAAFDMWIEDYAGMENPGVGFVKNEIKKHNHIGKIEFINGDSHKTVPEYFMKNPKKKFDLITVDGDHTEEGAYDDLCNVIPNLEVGGIIVFDDIIHPKHPYLLEVWYRVLKKFAYLSSYEFVDSGYGVAFAIRKANEEENSNDELDRFKDYYIMLNKWLKKKHEGKHIESYLKVRDIKSIAIYGNGEIGTRLYEELKHSNIIVKCFINNDEVSSLQDGIPVIAINKMRKQSEYDVIVVTPVYDYKNIKDKLIGKGIECDIVSLKEIIEKL